MHSMLPRNGASRKPGTVQIKDNDEDMTKEKRVQELA